MKIRISIFVCFLGMGLMALALATGCVMERPEVQEVACVPDAYSVVMLSDIYSGLDQEVGEKMLLASDKVDELFALPEIEPVMIDPALTGDDDPNVVKVYARFRLSIDHDGSGPAKKEHAAAADALDTYARQYRHNISLQKGLALYNIENEKFYAALRYAKAAVALDPNDVEALMLCSDICLQQERWQEAISWANQVEQSPRAVPSNENTALAMANKAMSLEKLGYLLAAGEYYQRSWQMMQYHRRFGRLDRYVDKRLNGSDMQLLLAARCYLQGGQVQQAAGSLAMLDRSVAVVQLVGYLAEMMTELPETRQTRFNLVGYMYRYMLAAGGQKEQLLRSFAAVCKKMDLGRQYLQIIQKWYSIRPVDCPALLDKVDYARALEYGGERILSRLVLANTAASGKAALAWLEFARLARQEKDYRPMLDSYVRCLDMNYVENSFVVKEFDNILRMDEDARQWLLSHEKSDLDIRYGRDSYGSMLVRAMISKGAGRLSESESILRGVISRWSGDVAAAGYLTGLLFEQRRWQDTLLLASKFTDVESQLYCARSLQQLGNYTKAQEQYERILAADSGNEQAIGYLAGLYLVSGKPDKAQELLLRSARLYPQYDQVQLELIKFYAITAIGKDSEADAGPDTPLGRFYDLCDKWDLRYSELPASSKRASRQLQDKLREVVESYPSCRCAREVLCRSYLKNEKLADAVVQANWLMLNSSDNYSDLQLAAEVFARAGRYDNQAGVCQLIWQKHSRTPMSLREVLAATRLAGEPSSALDLLREGMSVLEQDATFIRAVEPEAVDIFLILRDYSQGQELLENWLALCLTDSDVSSDKELIGNLLEDLSVFQTYAGNYDGAAATIDRLVKLSSDQSLYGLFVLVRNLNIRGMHDKSLSILDSLIATVNRKDVLLNYEYAYALIDAGRAEDAVRYIEQWQKKRPEAANRRFVLLQTLQRAGYYDQAIALVKEQLRDDPGNVELLCECVYNLISKGDEKSLNEAAAILGQLEKSKADPYKWFDYRIILDITMGNSDLALDHLLAMGAEKDSPATRSVQARIAFLSGDYKQASDIYRQLVKEFPDEPEYLSQLSFVLESAGEVKESIACMEEVLKLDPNNVMSRNNLAYTMLDHDIDIERAGTMLRQAIYQAPDNVAILDSVGWYYYKVGKYSEALEYFYHAAAADTVADPVIMDHLGDCLNKLGEPERAIVYWRRALKELDRRVIMEKNLKSLRDKVADKCR